MADETKIEWCDATLNLWWGCTKVSEGCTHCYAKQLSDQRYKRGCWGPKGTRREVKSWRATLAKISNRAKAENRRIKVFCSSMSDIFEGPETCGGEKSENWVTIVRLRSQLFDAIEAHPELDFLVLTKRIENAGDFLERNYGDDLPPNLWLGTSVENQEQAEARIPHLLKVPAAVRFLSCEPLLGELDLGRWLFDRCSRCGGSGGYYDCSDGGQGDEDCRDCDGLGYDYEYPLGTDNISWVIVGGESGPNARPMHPGWARSLRDQCHLAGVPFLFKQWGEWVNQRDFQGADGRQFDPHQVRWANGDGSMPLIGKGGLTDAPLGATLLFRAGKHRAGRLLDGRTWDEYPEVARG